MKILNYIKLVFSIIYTIYFDIVMVIMHIFGILLGILLIILGLRRFVYWLQGWWVKLLFLLGGKIIHIKGAENVEKGKNYLVVANHSSFYDIHSLLGFFNGMSFLAKKELMRNPILAGAIHYSRSIPVDRKDFISSMESLNKFIEQSDISFALGIFPEGTRTKDGRIQNFKRGFVRILKSTSLDLIPVTLNGFFNFKPKNRSWINPFARLEMIIHPPIKNSELKNLDDDEIVQKVRDIIIKDYKVS